MKKLAVFGDSFVEGCRKKPSITITKYNICHYLQKTLGVTVENHGKNGASNQSIANAFVRWYAEEDRSDWAVLFVWTECKRACDVHPKSAGSGKYDEWQYITGAWERASLRAAGTYDRDPAISRMWFEQSMLSCRMLCEDKSIPYLMTSSVANEWFLNKQIVRKDSNGNFTLHDINFELGNSKENWIEGNSPNNSMLDIISNNWLNRDRLDNVNHFKFKRLLHDFDRGKHQETLTECLHPTDEGNKLIAETLAPYIKKKLEE